MSVAPARALCNPYKIEEPLFLQGCIDPSSTNILKQHNDYQPTPLYNMKGLARKTGVANLLVKDESTRFGCNSFKPLGTLNSIFNILIKPFSEYLSLNELKQALEDQEQQTFITAGDPSLCWATAWASEFFGQKAELFLPEETCRGQLDAISKLGGKIRLVKGGFEDSLIAADETSHSDKKRHHIQERSWNGNDKPVRNLVDGYYTLFHEIGDQIKGEDFSTPDVVIIQSGSGLLLEAAARHFHFYDNNKTPDLICIEPVKAACMFESASSPFGKPVQLESSTDSQMTGLNYSCPSLTSWPVIRGTFDLFLTIDDIWTYHAMKLFHEPAKDDPRIEAGETGAAGLGALLALQVDPDLEKCKQCVSLNNKSSVLVINTEGISDHQLFEQVIYNKINIS